MRRFAVGYVVTDVKRAAENEYDVTPDVVDRWRLEGLPVRWKHRRARKDGSGIRSPEGIGVVRDWWRDVTYPGSENGGAVAVLLEITDPVFLRSPFSQNLDCLSLGYRLADHTRCTEVSLVETGQRKGTVAVFCDDETTARRVASERFGYKRSRGDAESRTNMSDEKLLEEAETVKNLAGSVAPEQLEAILTILKNKEESSREAQSEIRQEMDLWREQLADFMKRLTKTVEGKLGSEYRKRMEDFKEMTERWSEPSSEVDVVASFKAANELIGDATSGRTNVAELSALLKARFPKMEGDARFANATTVSDLLDLHKELLHKTNQNAINVCNDYFESMKERIKENRMYGGGNRKRTRRRSENEQREVGEPPAKRAVPTDMENRMTDVVSKLTEILANQQQHQKRQQEHPQPSTSSSSSSSSKPPADERQPQTVDACYQQPEKEKEAFNYWKARGARYQ